MLSFSSSHSFASISSPITQATNSLSAAATVLRMFSVASARNFTSASARLICSVRVAIVFGIISMRNGFASVRSDWLFPCHTRRLQPEMTDDGEARPHFLYDRCDRILAHIDEHELELPARLCGQSLQALAQTLRAPHRSHDDGDGRLQFRTLLAGSGHGNDEFPVFFGDEILRGVGRAPVLVFFLSHNHELLRRFQVETDFSARTI